MHVAGVSIFAGEPPSYEEFLAHIEGRLSLVPAFARSCASCRSGRAGRSGSTTPTSTSSTTCAITALPPPGSEEQLKNLASRVFAQQLDRTKPLWEIWLVEGLGRGNRAAERREAGARFALLSKTHHALVDGVAGVDITAVLFDTAARARDAARTGRAWHAAARADLDAAARRRADRARDPARGDRPLGARGLPRAAPARRRGIDSGGDGRARADRARRALDPAERGHRAAPALRLGADRPRRDQGDQEQARRDRERRRARGRDRRAARLPAAARRAGRRPHAEGDGPGQRAARGRVRHDRQPGRGDDGVAAGVRGRTRSSACAS